MSRSRRASRPPTTRSWRRTRCSSPRPATSARWPTFAEANEADLVALSVDGHVAIDVLMVKPDEVAALADLAGKTIGVKGALPPAIAVMLQQEAALVEGDDFETVLLEGFDPTAHWALPNVAAIPGWRSNEPGALERAGIDFTLYDPADYDIPGSFGLIYTNREFLTEHPSAAEDFMRATMRGLADAIADPAAAAAIAVERINGNGNPNFLSPEGEAFRWSTDAAAIVGPDAGGHEHRRDPWATSSTRRSRRTTRSASTVKTAPRHRGPLRRGPRRRPLRRRRHGHLAGLIEPGRHVSSRSRPGPRTMPVCDFA